MRIKENSRFWWYGVPESDTNSFFLRWLRKICFTSNLNFVDISNIIIKILDLENRGWIEDFFFWFAIINVILFISALNEVFSLYNILVLKTWYIYINWYMKISTYYQLYYWYLLISQTCRINRESVLFSTSMHRVVHWRKQAFYSLYYHITIIILDI